MLGFQELAFLRLEPLAGALLPPFRATVGGAVVVVVTVVAGEVAVLPGFRGRDLKADRTATGGGFLPLAVPLPRPVAAALLRGLPSGTGDGAGAAFSFSATGDMRPAGVGGTS